MQIIAARRHANAIQQRHAGHVHAPFKRLAHGDEAVIVVAAVARGVVAGKGGGVVVQHRGRGAAVAFDGGGVHGQGFDGRAWLAL